jgi:hypothetical protein
MPLSRPTLLPILGLLILPSFAWADPLDVIVCGKGGEPIYEQQFVDWGLRLRAALVAKLGHDEKNIHLLVESAPSTATTPTTVPTAVADLPGIRAALREVAGRATPEDDLFVYLIGHGSHQNDVSRFNIEGPDLTAEDLAAMLADIPARRIVVVNAASASAGFVNVLSGDRRIVCASTKSVEELNATDFMEYFIQGLEDLSADQNRDERISILEATQQAAALTQAGYLGQGLVATEHALIDDNGDGLGTRLPVGTADDDEPTSSTRRSRRPSRRPPPAIDGAEAALCFLMDYTFPPGTPPELSAAYLAALDAVERLKLEKQAMPPADYRTDLERLLIKAARLNRDIRKGHP